MKNLINHDTTLMRHCVRVKKSKMEWDIHYNFIVRNIRSCNTLSQLDTMIPYLIRFYFNQYNRWESIIVCRVYNEKFEEIVSKNMSDIDLKINKINANT